MSNGAGAYFVGVKIPAGLARPLGGKLTLRNYFVFTGKS
jgi:hypothetical protein